jgi:DNA-binding transcriptional ArsR family regulator
MNMKMLNSMANLAKLFGNELRIKILIYLLERHEACVGDVVNDLGIKQSTVSNQLKILKMGNIVKMRREGKKTFYSLADSHISTILNTLMDHVKEEN